MANLNDMFVLSWSNKQQCFHIEQVKEMLKTNLTAFKNRYPVDFIPIAFADSFEEANAKRQKLESLYKS